MNHTPPSTHGPITINTATSAQMLDSICVDTNRDMPPSSGKIKTNGNGGGGSAVSVVCRRRYRIDRRLVASNLATLGLSMLLWWLMSGSNRARVGGDLDEGSIQGDVGDRSEGPVSGELERVMPIAVIPDLAKDHMENIVHAFKRVGYEVRDDLPLTSPDWAVYWSFDYLYLSDDVLAAAANLRPHQKMNHFNGIGHITSKVDLSTDKLMAEAHFVPKSFRLPEQKDEFIYHMNEFSLKQWLLKSNLHRGVHIVDFSKNQEEAFAELKGTSFVQEYIANPLLIDGKRFDIGVYVVITSVNPLRVYRYDNDVIIRFCPEAYLPFDPEIVDKYVVADDYTPIWEMPSLKPFYVDRNHTMKESLSAYMALQGMDAGVIWSKIDQILQQLFKSFEGRLLYYNPTITKNFFELIRFDFIADDNLNVFLLEANMSPNLSHGHFRQNRQMYLHALINAMSLAGLTQPWRLDLDDYERNLMTVSDRDYLIGQAGCVTRHCTAGNQCHRDDCSICAECLTEEDRWVLEKAMQEHKDRWNSVRLVPSTHTEEEIADHSRAAKVQRLWFRERCLLDSQWCSK